MPSNASGKMHPKTKAFADKLLANPKMSATQAYIDTHKTENRVTAKSNAHQTLKRPSVQIYLQTHTKRAKERVVELVSSDKEDIALKASIEILDRTYGKSIQRQQTETTNINLNVEASEELSNQFAQFLKGL